MLYKQGIFLIIVIALRNISYLSKTKEIYEVRLRLTFKKHAIEIDNAAKKL